MKLVSHPKEAMMALNIKFTNESFNEFVSKVYLDGERESATKTLPNGQKVRVDVEWSERWERFKVTENPIKD